MTDRELLEAAAKAAGLIQDSSAYSEMGLMLKAGDSWEIWNPLTDDGDALRLTVKMRNDLTFSDALVMTWPANGADGESEPLDPDPCAATRRAIVRAAAEIGRTA